MSKGLVKSVAVTVLLTASILSFSSVAFGATSTIEQSVNKMKTELNKATTHYVYPSLEGKLVPSSELYPILNSAKKNYQLTRSAVVSSKISSTQKTAILNEMDTLYKEKVSEGLVAYMDAYNYATKYLDPLLGEIEGAQGRNDFATVEKIYHQLSYQLKGRSAILYRFTGKATRDLLLEKYKQPSDQKHDELMVPVTIYMKIIEVEKLVSEGKEQEAKKVFESIQALVELLPKSSSSTFINSLLKKVEKVNEVVKLASFPKDKIPTPHPADLVLKSVYSTGYEVKKNHTDFEVFNKEQIKVVGFEGNMFTICGDLSDTTLIKAARSISNISGRISYNDMYAFFKTASQGQIISKGDMNIYTDGKKIIVSWISNEQDLKTFLNTAQFIQYYINFSSQVVRLPANEIKMQHNSYFTDTFIDRFITERMTAEVINGETKYYLLSRESGHLVLGTIYWTEDTKVTHFEKNSIKYVEISEHHDSKLTANHTDYIILKEENGNYKVDDIRLEYDK
ncbi:hypothetical protein [Psychrobacillus sp. L4]|uniref:hypothetical protein n=1 Tax=Psychrobacillus sp. L4 TaxID=3236892 RepID=UPI0036F30AC0